MNLISNHPNKSYISTKGPAMLQITFSTETPQFEVCDSFKEASRKLEVFFIKVSMNKRKTYVTNLVAMSKSYGHKTKLDSNFVLALSLSY